MTHEITMSAKREKDAVIMVCQDNLRRGIYIEGLNHAAEELLGHKEEELIEEKIDKILSGNVLRTIADGVEYSDFGEDLGNVLHKIRYIHVLDENMEPKKVESKIFPTATSDNRMHYEILLRDMGMKEKFIHFNQHLMNTISKSNDNSDIMEVKSLTDMDNILHFFKQEQITGAFCLLGIDQEKPSKKH